MKQFLRARSRRFGYDGWALRVTGAEKPLEWTVSTTRAEARILREAQSPDLFSRTEIVKVKITVEAIPA